MSRMRAPLLAAALCAATAAQGGDAAYGEYLSSECVTCHRLDGRVEGIPSIIGWPADRFAATLQAYRAGARTHDVMQTVAGALGDEEIAALAAYFERIAPRQTDAQGGRP